MERILIIKLRAMGDVLRTTALLRAFTGDVTWVTAQPSIDLLRGNPYITRLMTPEQHDEVLGVDFDLVLNLDDDAEAADVVSKVSKKRLVGAYMDSDGQMRYTEDASGWFDMGLISRFGLERANELKKENQRTYQEFLFEMVGLDFHGEEYVFERPPHEPEPIQPEQTIGIEKRAGGRWPLKKWDKFDGLVMTLKERGYKVVEFVQRESVLDYVEDINGCDVIVSGDTLCMHIAIGLKKKTVAIFGPTPADEIYGYGRMHKIVAPLDCIKCLKRQCDLRPNCMQAIPLRWVYEKVLELAEEDQKATVAKHDDAASA